MSNGSEAIAEYPQVNEARPVGIEDIYAVLADIHRMQAEQLSVFRAFGELVNSASAELPAFLENLQESPIFGMLSGGGGGLLGGLFRR